MSRQYNLDVVDSDPLISSDLAVFQSSSRSRVSPTSPESTLPAASPTAASTESDPLLRSACRQKPFYRSRPLWLVPFAITAALVRGMTTAPRIEVFTQLACARLYPHPYNHTTHPNTFTRSSIQGTYEMPSPLYLSFEDREDEEDLRRLPAGQCLSDPAVQGGAARIQVTMTTTMGLLSALTTGWWGQFGERYGRTKVLAIASFGLLLTDLILILVSTPHSPFASHGHKLLIVAPIIEGLLGGWSTLQSATSAYLSDCTSSGSRASVFSRFSGVFFFGFSMGPALGGWIIRSKLGLPADAGKSVTPVFYLAVLCSLINILLVLLVFPESLPKEKQETARQQYHVERSAKGKGRDLNPPSENEGSDTSESVKSHRPGIVHTFLSPLAIFLPTKVTDVNGNKVIKDWSLTLLAVGVFATMLSTGVFQIKYMYADHVYSLGAEKLSYYISFMGGARAVFLLAVLPLFISTFKPKPRKSNNTTATRKTPKITKAHLSREIGFDLLMARVSVFIDILSNIFIVLAPVPSYSIHTNALSSDSDHSTLFFVMASGLACMGSAVVPAVQSLALCIVQARTLIAGGELAEGKGGEGVGKIFGAFAVLQATGQMILGPMLFGLVYSSTVATFPKAVFVVAAGILMFGLTCLLVVRSPVPLFKGKALKRKMAHPEDELERGRSRVSKDVWASSSLSSVGAGPSSAPGAAH